MSTGHAAGTRQVTGQRRARVSLLAESPAGAAAPGGPPDPEVLADLRLDQVVMAVARDRDEPELITRLLGQPVRDPGTIGYRHEVFGDLEDPARFRVAAEFTARMSQVRARLGHAAGLRSPQQRDGWFLDAAARYCDAVRGLAAGLADPPAGSRGLAGVHDYLAGYLQSPGFARLAGDTAARQAALAAITYQVRIKGPRVEVSRYGGAADYTAEIEAAFARFRSGAPADYRARYRTGPTLGHVGEQILALVARLFSDEFGALADYVREHARFLDLTVGRIAAELEFYLAYLDYLRPLRAAGLPFCYPAVSTTSKDSSAEGTFDLALAARLTAAGRPVVTNEFRLAGPERVILVTGPNQGGKTTFARTFGQLHHLAGTGCPVPGRSARLFVPDRVFTHFGRAEDLGDLAGKLEEDLLRIQKILLAATPDSVLVMNELFASTTAADARFLGEKVLTKIIDLGLLGVYVTFVDELAALGPAVVSMAATIVADHPAERTFQVVRKPADGLAYALAIARRHRLSYEQLTGRLS